MGSGSSGLGIDIAKKKHNASLLDHQGQIVFTNLAFTNDDAGLEKLLKRISALGKIPADIIVGMEATGYYWILLFQHLKEQGYDVLLLNPLITRARRNITIRGSKTDGLDSLLIARILREPDIKTSALPEAEVSELRGLTRLRYEMMQEAVSLKQAAQQSFARKQSQRNLTFQIRILLEDLNLNLKHVAELDKAIAAFLPQKQSLLKSLPGIGQVWAPTILAEIMPFFNPERKDGGDAFAAAAGLDPRLNQSGAKNGRARMSKRGSKYLRTALLEAAEVAVNIAKDPMFTQIFERQKAKNKPYWVALSHVANKMCHVIFAVLRDEKPYEPHLLCS